MKLEQELADAKKKHIEVSNSLKVLQLKNKDLMDAAKRKVPKQVNQKSCVECKNKEKARQDLLEQLNRAEKETLEVKNEKMQAILEQRDIEDRLRDRERDFHDKEIQLKTNAANELRDLNASHQKEVRKLRTMLKIKELELSEERLGHEEHIKLTDQVLS